MRHVLYVMRMEIYFLDKGVCVNCSKGCLDCSNLTTCLECNETGDYFLKDGVCEACTIPECLDCTTISTCI